MQIIKQNCGLEIDSKEIKVCFQLLMEDQSLKIKGSRKFPNNQKGFEILEKWLEKKREKSLPVHLTMEATGVYYENGAYYFNEQGDYEVHVVLPNMSQAYFKSLNFKSKTDEIDAQGLAQLGLERRLLKWKPVSNQMRELKKLVRERIRLLREKTMVSNQLHAELASYKSKVSLVKRAEDRIVFLQDQISEIEQELKDAIKQDKALKQRLDNVCTAKGIGFITAIGVVAEMGGFVLFKNRNQVISYAGYDIVKRESGTSIKGKERISKKGNAYVRHMLYMSAMSAAQHDPHHRQYYDRIVSKTSIALKGNVAIQRKLLLLIYTLFKNNVPYDPAHYIKVKQRLNANKDRKKEEKLLKRITSY